jgi:peptide/histidine transporter 3/4
MRSCSMALQLLSTALGSYLGGGVVAAVQSASTRAGAPWLPKDLNNGAAPLLTLQHASLHAAALQRTRFHPKKQPRI